VQLVKQLTGAGEPGQARLAWLARRIIQTNRQTTLKEN
jgi:hypothetical protein